MDLQVQLYRSSGKKQNRNTGKRPKERSYNVSASLTFWRPATHPRDRAQARVPAQKTAQSLLVIHRARTLFVPVDPFRLLRIDAHLFSMESAEREAVGYVGAVRRALRFGGVVPTLEETVERALGRGAVAKGLAREPAVIAYAGGRTVIWTSARLRPDRRRWYLAHALARWVLAEDGVDATEASRLRSPMAAELLLPAAYVAHALRVADAPSVAREYATPLTATILREAELLRRPTALVVPGRYARVRGDDVGRLPVDLPALELLAGRRGIGVRKIAVPEEGGVIVRAA